MHAPHAVGQGFNRIRAVNAQARLWRWTELALQQLAGPWCVEPGYLAAVRGRAYPPAVHQHALPASVEIKHRVYQVSGTALMHLVVEQNGGIPIASRGHHPVPCQCRTVIHPPLIEIHFGRLSPAFVLRQHRAFLLGAIELPHPQRYEKRRETQSSRH